ncbi:MAG: ATP-binding protein [Candidatus Bathyarchaeota archaeon]
MTNENLELKLGEPQTANMKVSAQILEHLSKGIYHNPAGSIKELISNAFDADATEVIIRAQPELDSFSITDNGEGMNFLDFKEKFLFISRSSKRDKGIYTKKYRRPIIGKIGIGFVAVSQICNKMVVISSKMGESHKFEAEIDFEKFRKLKAIKKDIYELSDVTLTNYKEEADVQYTIVILKELEPGFKRYLEDKTGIKDFKGKSFEKIIEKIEEKAEIYGSSFDLSKDLSQYWQILLEIANTVPVEYMENGPIHEDRIEANDIDFKEKIKFINGIKSEVKNLNFKVDFDGVILKKPIRFPSTENIRKMGLDFDIFPIKESLKIDDSVLKLKGYVYNQKNSIYPSHLRGLLIRLKNTAIGGPDSGFLNYKRGDKLFFNWTFGEIYVEEGLEDAMNISRSSFTLSHPHYLELRDFLHTFLQVKVFQNCRSRYNKRKKEDKRNREKKYTTEIEKQLQEAFGMKFEISFVSKSSKKPIEIDQRKKKLIVYRKHPVFKFVQTRNRQLLEGLLIRLFISQIKSRGNTEKLVADFLKRLESSSKES